MVNAGASAGTVEFGVAPDGTVVGLTGNLDTAQITISQVIDATFEPKLAHEIRLETRDGKPILVLTATRPSGVPYYEFKGVASVREGSRTCRMTLEEKRRLLGQALPGDAAKYKTDSQRRTIARPSRSSRRSGSPR